MKIGRLFPDLLATLGRASSPEVGVARGIKRLVALTGASAGRLTFSGGPGPSIDLLAGARPGSALAVWLHERDATPPRRIRIETLREPPPGWKGPGRPLLLSAALGPPAHPLGALLLLGRQFRRGALPSSFPLEFGLALEQVWRLHWRTLRLTVLNEVTQLTAGAHALEQVYEAVALALARLVRFDLLSVTLLDTEREEFQVVSITRSAGAPEITTERIPPADTLALWVLERRASRRVDDLDDPAMPPGSRKLLSRRGLRSAMLAPLVSQGLVIGTLNVAHRDARAFTDADLEALGEVARPLASAIEHARLHAETAERAEALAALNRTSQLITSRLDLGVLLETVSRSVTGLIGSTGCGIGLLNLEGTTVTHAAAHGFRTPEWSRLSMPVGEGIIGRVALSGAALRVDDVRTDPRSAQRDVDEKEGIRSMLSVPMRVGGELIGVISAFSTGVGFFRRRHQTLLEGFADQAGIAIQNARLFEESQRRGRERQALLEAGHAVNQSLEVGETIRLILQQAREVLGVQSCGLFTLDPVTGDLTSAASLDLDPETVGRIRLRIGEGITGMAVKERRPQQSADLRYDPRVRYPQVAAASPLRSMLAAPLVVGNEAIGALTVLRTDVHHFTPEEESLVVAFADQAAMALEHARLFSSVRTYSEQLEEMVANRTRELDEQKRFVEVVLETLPLGLYVLDGELRIVRANPEGAAAFAGPSGVGSSFVDLVPAAQASTVGEFLRTALAAREVRHLEGEVPSGAQPRTLRLTAAPLPAAAGGAGRLIVLVEDLTLQKRLEQQMLLTERLTTAGRLAAGVAHELNNPLATIAGCAEALKERARDPRLAEHDGFKDFPSYLSLIEEESFRCKEITGSLLQFVREPGGRREATDLNALVDKVLELLGHQSRFAAADVRREFDPGLPTVVVNEGQLRQVFLGLAGNALEAMEGRGVLTVTTRRHGAGEVEIVFADQGPGIPAEALPRVFDPFFTTKPPGHGTGLGLAIAQGIVADHGGRIEAASPVGRGATFTVVLPVVRGRAAS
jgi:two-component system NtrC family sensor kinase